MGVTAPERRIDPVDNDDDVEAKEESLVDTRVTAHSESVLNVYTVKLDVLYDIKDSHDRWCEGELLKIDRENDRVLVSYQFWDSEYDEWISDVKRRVAPLHTHTYKDGGRLKIGQRIEALDENQDWLHAFVVDETDTEVKVHFRNFREKYDVWIARADADKRIRPFGQFRFQMKKLHDSRIERLRHANNIKWTVRSAATDTSSSSTSAAAAAAAASASSSAATAAASEASPTTDDDDENNGYYSALQDNEFLASDGGLRHPRIRCVDDDHHRTRQITDTSDKYMHYIDSLRQQGLEVIKVSGDGNCLFRAVAHQIYGDESFHHIVRAKCMDYMEAEAEFFSQFVIGGREGFHLYLDAKRRDACWGDDPEIEALCELYDRPAEIWAYDARTGARKLRTFHESAGGWDGDEEQYESRSNINSNSNGTMMMNHDVDPADDHQQSSATSSASRRPVMRLSYYGGGHYDSVAGRDHRMHLLRSIPGTREDHRIRQALASAQAEAHAQLSSQQQQQWAGSNPNNRHTTHNNNNNNNNNSNSNNNSRTNSANISSPARATVSSSSQLSSQSSDRHRRQWAAEQKQSFQSQAQAYQDDLDEKAALDISLRAAQEKEQRDLDQSLMLSMQHAQQQKDEDAEVLRMVAAESEREFLERQLLQHHQDDAKDSVHRSGSVKDTSKSSGSVADDHDGGVMMMKHGEDAELAMAMELSRKEHQNDAVAMAIDDGDEEEAMFRLALQQSLMADAKPSAPSSLPSSSAPSASYKGEGKGSARTMEEEEDALLQQALAESLRSSSQSAQAAPPYAMFAPASSSSSSSYNASHDAKQQQQQQHYDPYAMEDGDYDEDLMRAIQESMR